MVTSPRRLPAKASALPMTQRLQVLSRWPKPAASLMKGRNGSPADAVGIWRPTHNAQTTTSWVGQASLKPACATGQPASAPEGNPGEMRFRRPDPHPGGNPASELSARCFRTMKSDAMRRNVTIDEVVIKCPALSLCSDLDCGKIGIHPGAFRPRLGGQVSATPGFQAALAIPNDVVVGHGAFERQIRQRQQLPLRAFHQLAAGFGQRGPKTVGADVMGKCRKPSRVSRPRESQPIKLSPGANPPSETMPIQRRPIASRARRMPWSICASSARHRGESKARP